MTHVKIKLGSFGSENGNKKIHKFTKFFILVVNLIMLCIAFNIGKKTYEMFKSNDIKEAFIQIHNFVSFKEFNNSTDNPIKQSFKTYIYSYTKPFLLELINNSTDDCLCAMA